MPFNINDFTANLEYGGARPTLFDVQMNFPGGIDINASRKLTFTCSAAELPGSTVGTVTIPYFGRVLPFPGDRQFSPWTINVINDEDFVVRDAFENWSNIINARMRNVRQTSTSVPALVKSSAIVRQYGRTGPQDVVRTYTFKGVWPGPISPIGLNWGDLDSVENFSVTLMYDYWDVQGRTVRGNRS